MSDGMTAQDRLLARLVPLRESAGDLYTVIREEERARIKRWEEEKPALESLVAALTQSKDIIKKEKKRVKAELVASQAKNDKEARQAKRAAAAAMMQANTDIQELQRQLAAHNGKLMSIDLELRRVQDALGRQQRPDERDMDTTKLVVLQDTRRLLGDEITKLKKHIFEIESGAKIEADRKANQESGWGELSRLEEQLTLTETRIDATKQLIYFPLAKGYRFSSGSGGVYCAAKDLYVSEVSGRYELDIQPLTAKDGTRGARLTFMLGGVSAAPDRNEFKEVVRRSASTSCVDSPLRTVGSGQAPPTRPSPVDPTVSQPGVSPSLHNQPPSPTAQPGLTRLMAPAFRNSRLTDDGEGSSPRSPHVDGTAQPQFTRMRESSEAGASHLHSQQAPQPSAHHRLSHSGHAGGTHPFGGPLPAVNLVPKVAKKGEMVAGFLSGLGKKTIKVGRYMTGTSTSSTPKRVQSASVSSIEVSTDLLELESADSFVTAESVSFMSLTAGRNESSSRLSKLTKSLSQKAPLMKEIRGKLGGGASSSSAGGGEAVAARLAAAEAALSASRQCLEDDDSEEDVPQAFAPASLVPAAVSAAVEAGTARVTRMFDAVNDGVAALSGAELPAKPLDADDIDSMLFATPEPQQSRGGVLVQLLAEGVEIVGERGTRVPDVQMKEMVLELEVVLRVVVEFSSVLGWQAPSGGKDLSFDVLQLEHKMRGNSLPLPRAALKALINMYLPSAIVGALMSVLPVELGKYVVDSQENLSVAGEIKMIGPVLSTFVADLVPPAKPPADATRKAADKWVAVAAAAARARAMLGLTEVQAMALSELFSGRGCLLESPRPLSVVELCRFFQTYQRSSMWTPLCNMWNRALQTVLDALGTEKLSFAKFMEGAVARIARKPVRVAMQVTRVYLSADADVALACVRDYFERMAKEFYKKTQGDEVEGEASTEPLEVQLENLNVWAMSLLALLRHFRTKFHSAACAVMASADREVFQVGAENVHYDGPLRLQVPLDVLTDSDSSFVWDVKLPDRQAHMNSMTTMLQEIMFSLSASQPGDTPTAGFQGKAEGSAAAVVEPAGMDAGPSRQPVLQNPVVGQVALRKVSVALRLDEQRLAELLQSGSSADAQMLAQMTGCLGDLFSASLDVGWNRDSDHYDPHKPQCMLTVQNNDVTRVRLDIESLGFQSSVSPKISVKVLYAVVAAMTLRFHSSSSYHMRFWDKVFQHLHEYLSKDSLDAFLCVSVRADTLAGGTKLRLVLSGDPKDNPQGLKNVSPLYLVNEVNLMTVLDTLKLMSDTQR